MTDEANQPAGESQASREPRTLLLFKAGARLFCLFADEAYNAVEWREPAPLPSAPQAVLGVVSLRGRMFTLLDTRALFAPEGAEAEDESHAIQVSNRFIIPLRGDEQLALTADDAPRAVEIFLDQLGPPPAEESFGSAARSVFKGEDEETRLLLDPSRLFALAMRGAERRRRRF